ncbi:DUF6313 family protein [Streptomyces agglomeratus]|uniref:DUF6313 family protein n=1 Tax=Streptomyces agglomeratus TaxID=285458 RepID=UPI00114CC8E1|nr:DUF6313 family protein [Streptomyces agglomeratus]
MTTSLPSPTPPPPPDETWKERLQFWWEINKASTNKLRYWLFFRAWWVILIIAGLYLANGFLIGFGDTWEILVSPSSEKEEYPALAWPLSVVGWLIVPALVGGISGYVVTQQTDRRRARPLKQLMQDLEEEVRNPSWPGP